MAIVRLQNVSKRYPGGFDALRAVSLAIDAGELVFLTGHSGAGKTSLLKLIAAVERPTGGKVEVNGEDITRIRPAAIPYLRRHLGLLLQDQKLLYDRSVFENVMLPLAVAGQAPKEAARRVRAALDKVGLLGREHMNPVSLSAGEQQRVGVARAVVNRPGLLIADEPTANVDPEHAVRILDIFKSFSQVGVTVVVASHDLGLAQRFARRVITLKAGSLIAA